MQKRIDEELKRKKKREKRNKRFLKRDQFIKDEHHPLVRDLDEEGNIIWVPCEMTVKEYTEKSKAEKKELQMKMQKNPQKFQRLMIKQRNEKQAQKWDNYLEKNDLKKNIEEWKEKQKERKKAKA